MIRARRRKIDESSDASSITEPTAIENIPTYIQPTATIIADNAPTVIAPQDTLVQIDPLSTTPISIENITTTQPQSSIMQETTKI